MLRTAQAGKKEKWVIFAVIITLAVVWLTMALGRKQGGRAVISADGRVIAEFDLVDYTDPARVTMRDLGVDLPVSFELMNHKIRFVDVVCPDHLCENYGFIGAVNQTAVCMPNRVAVTITQ